MDALARVVPVSRPDANAPGLFHLSTDGALARALTAAGFRDVRQERVQLSQFTRDPTEFWAMLTDMAGPVAPLLAGLVAPDRDLVLTEVTEAIAHFRTGDVYRIPAQAQLAWGRGCLDADVRIS